MIKTGAVALMAAVMMAALMLAAVMPACTTQEGSRETATRVPAVPPPAQSIPPNMPPPPGDQRVMSPLAGTTGASGIGPRSSGPEPRVTSPGIGLPEEPSAPEEPGAPESPEAPDTPESPETPPTPETPDAPGAPETPEAPETPGEPGEPGEPEPAPAPAPEPAPAPTPPPAPPPTDPNPGLDDPAHAELPVLATYRRSGGILGMTEVLTVYDNGRLELSSARGPEPEEQVEHQVDASELLALRRVLEDEAFQALEGPYTNEGGADLITYTITAHTDAGEKTVVATDGMTLPAPLTAARQELERLRKLTAEPR